jgi:hypothetical protein
MFLQQMTKQTPKASTAVLNIELPSDWFITSIRSSGSKHTFTVLLLYFSISAFSPPCIKPTKTKQRSSATEAS